MVSDIEKYEIKDKGLKLEKSEPEKAIEFYKSLLNHKCFINDFWPYRRLVLMYKKTRQFDEKTNIIKTFFKSGIYCNNHQFMWFRNKLRVLADKDYITSDEIEYLTGYFKTHSLINKDKANTPLPIADRIRKRNGKIVILNEKEYDNRQKQYEYEVRCSELNRQKRYGEYIELLNHMIDDLGYRRYSYFQKLCVAYRRFNDYDNEVRIINKYMNGESARTKISDEWFEKRLHDVESIKNPKSEKKDVKPKLNNYPNISDFKDKYVYEISFNVDELNLTKPPIFEYDFNLNGLENLKRKNMLIQYGKVLTSTGQTVEAIRHYKYLCNNTYFSNDWYPYRQLAIIYAKTKDYHANLVNIKKLLRSNTYLNRYQFLWFSEKVRLIMEQIDVNEYDVRQWFEYYESHGALNGKKSNKFLADRFMCLNDDTVLVLNEEYFNHLQERHALEETGCVYERVGNCELAVTHYNNIIADGEFNYYNFYQRICLCLEKLKDYNRELKAIKLYYTSPPINVCEYSDEWFEKRLGDVNAKLNTDYTVDDLKS